MYWAFSESGNVNRKHFSQASLIWFLIVVVIAFVVGGLGGLFSTLMR